MYQIWTVPFRVLVAVVVGAAPLGGSSGSGGSGALVRWHQTVTPHFVLHHQKAFVPNGFTLALERIHNRLRLDLSMFSPWMARERVDLYLYGDPKSYHEGEFRPPDWSNGVAFYQRRLIALHEVPGREKLENITAHELTHLFFESYWGEAHKEPPHWLGEGLAMMEEAQAGSGAQALASAGESDWYRAVPLLSQQRLPPLAQLFAAAPQAADDATAVALWYVQSYSVVLYLFRQHTRLQFHNFCSRLRDGEDLSKALWLVYRYPTLQKFEAAWREWLRDSFPVFKRGRMRPIVKDSFHSLRERKQE